MPAKSCGFCVAMTKNGSGKGMVWPSSETWPSFIASSSADWVRGTRAVDFVREKDVREDRPLAQDELAAALIVDADAKDIAGQEVARELHSAELAAEGFGQGAREGSLADAGDVLDEQVPARQEGDEGELHRIVLALEGSLDGLAQRLERGLLLGDAGGGSRHGARVARRCAARVAVRFVAETLCMKKTARAPCPAGPVRTTMRPWWPAPSWNFGA